MALWMPGGGRKAKISTQQPLCCRRRGKEGRRRRRLANSEAHLRLMKEKSGKQGKRKEERLLSDSSVNPPPPLSSQCPPHPPCSLNPARNIKTNQRHGGIVLGGKSLLASCKSSNYDAYERKFLPNHPEKSVMHLTAVWSGDGVSGAGRGSDVPLAERTRQRPRSEAV